MPIILPLNIFFASLMFVSVWPRWMPSAPICSAIFGWSLIINTALCFFVRVFSFFAVFSISCSGRFFSRYWIIFMPASSASFVSFSAPCFERALSVMRYSFGIFGGSIGCHLVFAVFRGLGCGVRLLGFFCSPWDLLIFFLRVPVLC